MKGMKKKSTKHKFYFATIIYIFLQKEEKIFPYGT